MKLVIVESPTKCPTIKRYLGDEYEVVASLGHIDDLSMKGKGGLGVDIENGFKPTYVINPSKRSHVEHLKKLAKEAEEVILATDPDREGEAIAWHLAKALNLDVETTKRLEFHEITRDALTEAITNPRKIDEALVASQETRRILDRIIGFKLSYYVHKTNGSESAGRVQSAVLKLVNDHEQEIKNFKSEEYWTLNTKVNLNKDTCTPSFLGVDGKEIDISNENEMNDLLKQIGPKLKVISVSKTLKEKESKPPFSTSTLQQEANTRLKFNTNKTMSIAQSLYEGLNLNGEHIALITYMRTESTCLSETFIKRASDYITSAYGKEYLGKTKKGKLGKQNGHSEGIRPSSNHRTPESVKEYLSSDQYRLYKLIYDRALASLMKPRMDEVLSVVLQSGKLTFKLEFKHTIFQGYEVLYHDEESKYFKPLPEIKVGDELDVISKSGEQKFTNPPSRYTEGKLVGIMEEVGIGRPSTYASTIKILKTRKYVTSGTNGLEMTEKGTECIELLNKHFSDIIEEKFTAKIEESLDTVQNGEKSRIDCINKFYVPFMKDYNEALEHGEDYGTCPVCGSPLVSKLGRHGQFISCSNYPTCKYIKKEEKKIEYTGNICPECGSQLVYRYDKRGKKFEACSNYPKCKYTVKNEEMVDKTCPNCGSPLVKKKGKYGYFLGCSNYPSCNYMEKIRRGNRK